MAECYDFFDSSRFRRSSPLRNEASWPVYDEAKEELCSRELELTLGPTDFTSASPHLHQIKMGRITPESSSLQQQSSGNPALALLGPGYISRASCLQSEGFKFSSLQEDATVRLSRHGSANLSCAGEWFLTSADCAHPSAISLLPEGKAAYPSRDHIWQTLQKKEIESKQAPPADDLSSLLKGRAMSLHAAFPMNSVKDLKHCPIWASSSKRVLHHAHSQLPSNIELFADQGLQQSITSSLNPPPDELENLQSRKEVLAWRRLHARKKRRILVEEKQHKRGRQIGLLHADNMPDDFPDNRGSHDGVFVASEDNVGPEFGCIFPDEPILDRPGNKLKKSMDALQQESESSSQASPSEDMECTRIGMQSDSAMLRASIHWHDDRVGLASFPSNRQDSGICVSMIPSELESQSLLRKCSSTSNMPLSLNENGNWKPYEANDLVRKAALQAEEARTSMSNQASSLEIRAMSSLLSGAPVGCSSLRFPFMRFAAQGSACAVDATGTDAPYPCMPPDPDASNPDIEVCLPRMHGAYHTAKHAGIAMLPPRPGALLSRTMSAVGDSEGNREGNAFSPLSKTFPNTKIAYEEPQNAGAHLDFQASLSASQLSSSTSTAVSDTSVGRSLLLDRQRSRPLGGRLLSQSSCVVDQALSWSRPVQSSVPVSFDGPPLRLGDANLKQEERAKQEEVSSESQLASEHSMDASHSQSTGGEKNRNGAFVGVLCVTTTGNGPNGKTINGFMHIANGGHVRLVCCCHGTHMSPAEFVEHSGSNDLSNPERNIVVSRFPHLNQEAASTPV